MCIYSIVLNWRTIYPLITYAYKKNSHKWYLYYSINRVGKFLGRSCHYSTFNRCCQRASLYSPDTCHVWVVKHVFYLPCHAHFILILMVFTQFASSDQQGESILSHVVWSRSECWLVNFGICAIIDSYLFFLFLLYTLLSQGVS